jgi:putative ABC transport system permease protein
MRIYDMCRVSIRTLGKNKLRSLLTVLGVVIGIASVIAMVSIGQSLSEQVQTQVQGFGANMLVVFPSSGRRGGVRQGLVPTLTAADAHAIAKDCPSVRATSPVVGATGQVIGGNVNWQPREMSGVGPDHLTVRNWNLATGEFFSERDMTSASKVCVLGQTVVARLFSGSDPVGQQIRVKNIPFRVIGTLERKGANLFGQDQDDVLFMPYTTAQKRLQGSPFNHVNVILISARSQDLMVDAEEEVRSLLSERHRIAPGQPPDFDLQSSTEVANTLGTITWSMTFGVSFIACISLFVGGIGIMNIMLVSVTERTREIGLRMAVGARPKDILRQFLFEAVVLSSLGGVIGILLGLTLSYLAIAAFNAFVPAAKWPFVFSFPWAIGALLFSSAVGIFFGFYPAWRASRLDPIEALRYE